MPHISVKDTTLAALGTALIAVCSWISVPTVIPFTLQTFAVCLLASLPGMKAGLWSLLAYMALGAAGVPVFSGFRGGPGVLLGVTGGYLLGFFFTALTVGLSVRKFGRKLPVLLLSMAAGVLLCYAFGTAWFMLVYTREKGPVSLGTALSLCVLPYLIPDAVKIALAAVLSRRLTPLLQKM